MKFFLSCWIIFFALFSSEVQAQDFVMMDVSEVDQPPVFKNCNVTDFNCSIQKITAYLVNNINKQILIGLNNEDAFINLKVIVNDEGEVKKVLAQGKNNKLKAEAIRITESLPNFTPAVHQGKKVNVIIDIPLQLESKDPLPFKSDSYDTPAMVFGCKNENDPLQCTSTFVQKFVLKNYRTDRVKMKEGFIKIVFNFIIDENGRPTEIIATGNNESMKKEGIRAINKLPDLIPATKDGKNIPVSYSIPVTLLVEKAK